MISTRYVLLLNLWLIYTGCAEDTTIDPVAASGSDVISISGDAENNDTAQSATDDAAVSQDGENSSVQDASSELQDEDATAGDTTAGDSSQAGDTTTPGDGADGTIPEGDASSDEPAPTIDSVDIASTPDWGLGASMQVVTTAPSTLEVTLTGPNGEQTLPESAVQEEGPNTYRVLVLGMMADQNTR